jgi:hypothetical protein
LERVTCGGGANLILQFWLERGSDGTKRYRKIKQGATSLSWLNGKERARCGSVMILAGGEATLGREKREEDVGWADANLTEPKMEKINVIDSADKNGRGRFKATIY